jgi:hypothetical protein
MGNAFGWLRAFWRTVDSALRDVSDGLQKAVRTLRLLRAFLIVSVVVVVASAVVGIWRPDWLPYAYAAAVVFLVIPLIILLALVSLPLRAKSLVRLIDAGYPRMTRELAIRVAARKLHEQSIESEALLLETAIHESRKLLRRYRERARRVRDDFDDSGQYDRGRYDERSRAEDERRRDGRKRKGGRNGRQRVKHGKAQ